MGNYADFPVTKIEPSETAQLVKSTSATQEVRHGDPTKLKLSVRGGYKNLEQRFVTRDSSKCMESALHVNLVHFEFKVQNVSLVHAEPFNLVMVLPNVVRVRVE